MPPIARKRIIVMQLRVATWNLERPGKTRPDRPRRIVEIIQKINADIWILTETNEIVVPGSDYQGVASTPVDGLHRSGENWTTIWSRFPVIGVIATHAPEIAVCVEIDSPVGPLVVFGTVLPYHADRVAREGYRGWQSHYESIPMHGADWRKIRGDYPSHCICVAGDFNQSRDERRWDGRLWYGTQKGRTMLTRTLIDCDLACVTEEDFVATGKLTTRSSIDHICIDKQHAASGRAVGAWEPFDSEGNRLSDHNGVWVDLGASVKLA